MNKINCEIEKFQEKFLFKSELLKTWFGQNYVIVINNVYSVEIFIEIDERYLYIHRFEISKHTSQLDAENMVNQIENCLTNQKLPDFIETSRYLSSEIPIKESLKTQFGTFFSVNKSVRNDPDSYLTPGDHVQLQTRNGVYYNSGIYLGSNKVAYVSYDTCDQPCVCESDWPSFYGDHDLEVYIFCTLFKFKSNEQIVSKLKEMIGQTSNYHKIHHKNNQQFAVSCQSDMQKLTDFELYFVNLANSSTGTIKECYIKE